MLEVRLGGGLAIECDGRALELPRSRRGRALLAWLALNPGTHARSEVAARFWPDVRDDSARTSLRAALSELRGALGPAAGHLVATRDRVGIEGARVDALEFARLVGAGSMEAALATCPGELLTGFDDEWALDARDAHRRGLAGVLEALAVAAGEAGELAAAIDHSRAALALDPLDEAAARRLMERLANTGDKAGALAVAARLTDRLRTELGIAASAQTRALVAQLRGPDGVTPAERPPLAPPAAIARSARGTPFTGRAAERALLATEWDAAIRDGARRTVLVSGEPGIGKTRLLHELAGAVDGDVLLGRCYQDASGTYAAIADVLDRLAADLGTAAMLDRAGPAGPELARICAAIAAPAPGLGDRRRLFDAVDALLASLTAERPLLLVLDDVQWADAPTLALVAHLARSVRPARMLIAATCRRVPNAIAGLLREEAATELRVAALELADVAEMVGTSDAEAARSIHARSGGNAFIVEQLARSGDDLPVDLRRELAGRVDALGEGAAGIVRAAAVLGHDLDPSVLAAMTGATEDESVQALEAGITAQLLRDGATSAEFAHDLVREAVNAEIGAPRRTLLHRRAAGALAARGRYEAAAAHLAHVRLEPEDAGVLRTAAERAYARMGWEDAAAHADRAIAAAPSSVAAHLHLLHGDALVRAGERPRAREAFAAAADVARTTGDTRALARAALGHGGLGVVIAHADPATVALLEEAAAAADPDGPDRARALARLAVELYYAPPRARSEELAEAAVATARESGDAGALVYALNARHVALWRPDRLGERERVAAEMLTTARAVGDREAELQALNWLVVDAYERGDGTGWRARVDEHERLADELRLDAFRWYAPLWRGIDAMLEGDAERGDELVARARAEGERAGDGNAGLFADMAGLIVPSASGRFDQAHLDFLQANLRDSPARDAYRAGTAWLLAEWGRFDESREQLDLAIAADFGGFDANWMSAVAEAASTCVLLDGAPHAQHLYDLLAPYAGRPLTAGRAVTHDGWADRLLGALAAALGDRPRAREHLRAAVGFEEGFGALIWARRSRELLAALPD